MKVKLSKFKIFLAIEVFILILFVSLFLINFKTKIQMPGSDQEIFIKVTFYSFIKSNSWEVLCFSIVSLWCLFIVSIVFTKIKNKKIKKINNSLMTLVVVLNFLLSVWSIFFLIKIKSNYYDHNFNYYYFFIIFVIYILKEFFIDSLILFSIKVKRIKKQA